MKKTTPEILKDLRKEKGFTQKDVANLLGFSTTAYQNYERGINEPSNKSLCILADFYGVTTDYLLGREPPKNPIEMLNLDRGSKNIIKEFAKLPEETRKFLLDLILLFAKNVG